MNQSKARYAILAYLFFPAIAFSSLAEAETSIVQKKWYSLQLQLDKKTVLAHADHAGCSEIQREAKKSGDLTQMWAFLPAGNDYYYLCSRKNGQCITYKKSPVGNLLSLRLPSSRLADTQKLRLINKGKNKYQIKFKTGDYLHNSRDLTSCSAKHAIKHRSKGENSRNIYTLLAKADIKVPNNTAENKPGEIPLPPLPTGAKKGSAPPSETDPITIGKAAVPYFVITDPLYKTTTDKIRDRIVYYTIERKQNWILTDFKNYDPGENTFETTIKNGINTEKSQEMLKTTSMKVMSDMNVKYEGVTLDFKTEFAKALQVKESSTTKEITETTTKHSYKVNAKQPFSIAQWQLQDIYTLSRVSNKKSTPISTWTVKDNRYTPHTTYPEIGVNVVSSE